MAVRGEGGRRDHVILRVYDVPQWRPSEFRFLCGYDCGGRILPSRRLGALPIRTRGAECQKRAADSEACQQHDRGKLQFAQKHGFQHSFR